MEKGLVVPSDSDNDEYDSLHEIDHMSEHDDAPTLHVEVIEDHLVLHFHLLRLLISEHAANNYEGYEKKYQKENDRKKPKQERAEDPRSLNPVLI